VAGLSEFDLSSLSNYNHQGIRNWRLALALGTGIAVVAIGILEFLLLTSAPIRLTEPGVLYTLVASWLVMAYLSVVLGSFGFRFWAAPPVRMKSVPGGLEFSFVNGQVRRIQWHDQSPSMELLDRSNDTKVPEEARYRLWVEGSLSERWLPWRTVVPLVYLTEPAALEVLQSAKMAGMMIYDRPAFNPISILSRGTCHAYTIS
jgi:hypothetical protein